MFPSDCWDIAVCSAFRTLTQMEQICSPSWYLSLHSVFSPDVCQSYESDHCSSMFFFPSGSNFKAIVDLHFHNSLKATASQILRVLLYTTLLSFRVLQSSSHLDFHHTTSRYRDALTTCTITSSTFAHWCSLPPTPRPRFPQESQWFFLR